MTRMTNSADTLATARRLETDFGMDKRAAEGVATAINDRFIENVATKADIELLKADIQRLEERLENQITTLATETKADIRGLDTKIDMLKYTIGFGIAVLGLVLATLQIYGLVR